MGSTRETKIKIRFYVVTYLAAKSVEILTIVLHHQLTPRTHQPVFFIFLFILSFIGIGIVFGLCKNIVFGFEFGGLNNNNNCLINECTATGVAIYTTNTTNTIGATGVAINTTINLTNTGGGVGFKKEIESRNTARGAGPAQLIATAAAVETSENNNIFYDGALLPNIFYDSK